MKVLVSVAVFGLVPVPAMSDAGTRSGSDAQTAREDVRFSPLLYLLRLIAERTAKTDRDPCVTVTVKSDL